MGCGKGMEFRENEIPPHPNIYPQRRVDAGPTWEGRLIRAFAGVNENRRAESTFKPRLLSAPAVRRETRSRSKKGEFSATDV